MVFLSTHLFHLSHLINAQTATNPMICHQLIRRNISHEKVEDDATRKERKEKKSPPPTGGLPATKVRPQLHIVTKLSWCSLTLRVPSTPHKKNKYLKDFF